MKKLTPILLGLALAGLAFPVQAAKSEKKNKRGGDVFARYDLNANGALDKDEIGQLQQDFAELKKLDLNGDGKIDDEEAAAAKLSAPKKKKKKEKN